MNKEKTLAEFYSKFLKLYKQYEKVEGDKYNIQSLIWKANSYLYGVKMRDEYGYNVNPEKIDISGWSKIHYSPDVVLAKFGEGTRREISWEDNGKQPGDEMLILVGFPTGAYIFGQHYPVQIFKDFFAELKTYNPKYIDTTNKELYFEVSKGAKVYNELPTILKKYRDKSEEERKVEEIKELESKLKKLKNN